MKTKNNILYSLLALGMVGSIGSALAQSSAVTDPVGYHQLTAYGNDGRPSRITPQSVALVNKSEFAGCAETVGASFTVAGTPLTAGAFDDGQDYLTVTDGAGAGAWSGITSNTDNTINLADDLSAFSAAGSKFVVRRHVTISDIFGAGNEAGLQGADSAGDADNVNVIDSSPGGATTTIFFSTSALAAGWRDVTFGDASDFIVPPGQGWQVRRNQPGDVTWIYAGHVKVEPTMVVLDGGAINVEQILAPVGTTLADSGLEGALDAADGAGDADNVLIFGAGPDELTTAFFSTSALAPGWRDITFGDVSGQLLPEGSGILIKKLATTSTWVIPAPVIAP